MNVGLNIGTNEEKSSFVLYDRLDDTLYCRESLDQENDHQLPAEEFKKHSEGQVVKYFAHSWLCYIYLSFSLA